MIPPSAARCVDDRLSMTTFAGPVRVRMVKAGMLRVPSGLVAAGDPEFLKDAQAIEQRLAPGDYPVILTVAEYADKDQRIAAARLAVTDRPAMSWKEAKPPAYGVDSGVGCFVDSEALARLRGLRDKAYEQYWQKLSAALDRNYADTRTWADTVVDAGSGANLIAFSSGFGDGGYGLYLGHDAEGRLACILADFGLLLSEEEVELIEEEP